VRFEGGRRRSGDERDQIGDERDRIADERDAVANAREAAWVRWEANAHGIVAAADLRDQGADVRDSEAYGRDVAATDDAPRVGGDEEAHCARTFARADRDHAKANRIASAVDRFRLSFLTPAWSERRRAARQRLEAGEARLKADVERHEAASPCEPEAYSAGE
jgi:hypothetical protein